MGFIAVCLLLLLLYILWDRVGKMYYVYWFYTRQGIECPRFPLPFIGSFLHFKKHAFKNNGEFTENPIYNYLNHVYGQKLPPIIISMTTYTGTIFINDPEYLNELYVTKNKYLDKAHRVKTIMHDLFGESLLFDKSTPLQAQKRKSVSSAFYKDKMIKMLEVISKIAFDQIQDWKSNYSNGNNEMVLVRDISKLIMTSIAATVFGLGNADRKLKVIEHGHEKEEHLGSAIRLMFHQQFTRLLSPTRRMFYPLLEKIYLPKEKECQINCFNLRQEIKEIIKQRRTELASLTFDTANSTDFLTLILQDEQFKDDDLFLIDECVTFMVASTQTTTLMISNAIKFLIVAKDSKIKLRQEISKHLGVQHFSNLNFDEWNKLLDYEGLNQINYLTYVVNESLRINPPIEISSGLCLNETQEIAGHTILKDQVILVNMRYLQNNPDEWQEPERFIPERFDPTSKYYLTPKNTKRHPLSFGPFLGGRRICLGKTFAENIGKLLLTMITTQFDFEFVDKKYNDRLPRNAFDVEEPDYTVFLHELK